jgi:ABC-type dipeptide/oligopeptide/nickel transport system permease component
MCLRQPSCLPSAALLLAWLIAIPLGIFAATRHNTPWDRAASTLAVAGLAIPNIWLGPLLILLFGVTLQWLPLPGDDPTRLNALILPSVTIGTALAASLFRHTRSVMLEVLKQQYILAAKARGVPTGRVLFQHSLRNALLPIMTVGAAQLGALLSGTVIAEKIFERPGLGTLFLEAFFARDIPIIQGCVLVVAVVYVSINLAVDLLYGVVDPRRKAVMIGVVIVCVFLLIALFGPYVAPYHPEHIDLAHEFDDKVYIALAWHHRQWSGCSKRVASWCTTCRRGGSVCRCA